MPASFEVRGADKLANLGAALKGADRELRKMLLRRIRAAGGPTKSEIRRKLGEKMPQAGGLADDLANAKVGLRSRTSGKSAGVRLDVKHSKHDLASIDRGILRHPTFGHEPWVVQDVPERVISDTVEGSKPEMQRAVLRAMEDTAAEIIRRV